MFTKQQITLSGLTDVPRGMDLIDNPELNKGTAFTEERNKLQLPSLLPPLTDIRTVAVQIAIAVGLEAQRQGLAAKNVPHEA